MNTQVYHCQFTITIEYQSSYCIFLFVSTNISMTIPKDEEFIIDPSLIVEPDESTDDDWATWEDEFGFNDETLQLEGESIIDNQEFDLNWEDIYESYDEDPSILEEDDDL